MVDRTVRWLLEAGIEPGMRVLDVGCGAGELSLLLAELVGDGEVVGVDRDERRLVRARQRAEGLSNVTFECGDIHELDLGLFDAAVARRVLKFQDDPVATVRSLIGVLRPGGLVLFEEVDATMPPVGRPALPLHEQARSWIWAVIGTKARTTMGFDLYPVFTEAGLQDVQVRAELLVQTANQGHRTVDILRHLLPALIRDGLATAEDVDIDTLELRLQAERAAGGGTWIGDVVFVGWGRTPE